MTRVVRATAALVAAVVVLVGLALPPARRAPATGRGDDSTPGVFHVHTNRSDGRSSPEVVAAAAARAGLRFVVFTDHGDATRKPDPPTYRSGVLCIDAVEISTDAGHLIALGLPAAPYPLAGEARDVLEDVHRLGGIGIAAHPDSPREDLQWRDWDAPIDGVELVNLDTVWRVHVAARGWRTAARVIRDLATYLVRPGETIASMVTDDPRLAQQWTALARRRRLPTFAGVDAHARLELRGGTPGDNRWTLALPGYETVFRTLTMRVHPDRAFGGDAAQDGALLLRALAEGRAYSSLDGVLSPPAFDFSLTTDGVRISQGGEVEGTGPVSVAIATNAPPSFTTTIWRNGEVLISQPTVAELVVPAPTGPAVYRAEIRATDRPGAPAWVISNGIFVRQATASNAPAAPAPSAAVPLESARSAQAPRLLFTDRESATWTTESAAESRVALDVGSVEGRRELQVRFGLPGGDVYGQYAAIAAAVDEGLSPYRTVRFSARSSQPMRVSAQLRVPATSEGRRWRRSFYVDEEPRAYELRIDDFRAVGPTPADPVPLDDVRSVLFVVDQTNTSPGTSGRIWLTDVVLH